MKAIQLRKNVIEIPFQDMDGKTVLTLEFDRTDENKKRLEKGFKNLHVKMEQIEKEDVTLEEAKLFIEEIADSFLGEGSFEKMYTVNPSLDIVSLYLYQIAVGIKEELEEEDLKAVEQKYLG